MKRTIVISDVHLGTKDSKSKELIEFLNNTPCETLLIVGDIIDGWALKRGGKLRKTHTKLIRKIIKLSESGTNVIWIKGNHDDFLNMIIPNTLGKIKILDNMIYESANGKSYYVAHGDALDIFITKMKFLAIIGSISYDILLWINRIVNKVRKIFGMKYYSLSKVIKENVKKAVSFISNYENQLIDYTKHINKDGIICGHVHHPDIKTIDGIEYLNSGDWVENLSALIEDKNGNWEIYKYEE